MCLCAARSHTYFMKAYYSVQAGRKTVVTEEQIRAACGISGIDLAACKIWLETTAENGSLAYARMAEKAKTIKTIDAVALTGVKPAGGSAFPAKASCGTVTISNKAATPVTITGNNQTLPFDGSTIDVSKYFTIDENAGTRSYSLVQDTGVTGEGSLSGAVLTVTKPGVFQVKLTTAANGNYAAEEKIITLTVNYSSGAVTLAPGKTVVRECEGFICIFQIIIAKGVDKIWQSTG